MIENISAGSVGIEPYVRCYLCIRTRDVKLLICTSVSIIVFLTCGSKGSLEIRERDEMEM